MGKSNTSTFKRLRNGLPQGIYCVINPFDRYTDFISSKNK